MECNQDLPEINLVVESEEIAAKTRKLKAVWSYEAQQDLRSQHNLDAEAELTAVLAQEINLEIDREVLSDLRNNAGTVASWDFNTALGDTIKEKYESLYVKVVEVSNVVHRKTLRGGCNWLVTSPEVASIFETPMKVRGALVIAISQSGRSPDLLATVEAYRAGGAHIVALVNDEESPLATGADTDDSYVAIRERAGKIMDQPQGTTSLSSSVQSETRSRAIQVLIDSGVVRVARITDQAEKAEALKELDGLRAKLLEAQQNDPTTPMMLATDAKIMQMRGDIAGAAAKWDAYYTRVPQPSSDAKRSITER
jgi:hypothetical protein